VHMHGSPGKEAAAEKPKASGAVLTALWARWRTCILWHWPPLNSTFPSCVSIRTWSQWLVEFQPHGDGLVQRMPASPSSMLWVGR
jgi:hypothetical protein